MLNILGFFLNRMLQLLRDNIDKRKILITSEFRKDLAWFNSFLSHYNGFTYYEPKCSHMEVHLDACLTGLGGSFESMVYALAISKGHMNYNIAHCDNMAVVEVLRNGIARDTTLALLARNIFNSFVPLSTLHNSLTYTR